MAKRRSVRPSSCENEQEELEREKYERKVLKEIQRQELDNNPVAQWMHAVAFVSRSKGKGRKPRRYLKEVWLIQCNGDLQAKRWRSWGGEDQYHFHPRTGRARLPWDEWATEILDPALCEALSTRGINSDEYLRVEVHRLVHQYGGRF